MLTDDAKPLRYDIVRGRDHLRSGGVIPLTDDSSAMDALVSGILDSIRPQLEAALRAAFEHGQRASETRYAEKVSQVTRLLNELSPEVREHDIPVGSFWLAKRTEEGRAALGTVKPRILELVSRDVGASVPDIEGIGIKPNSIRGTLYALQKDGLIERRGDRWYAAISESNRAPAEAEAH